MASVTYNGAESHPEGVEILQFAEPFLVELLENLIVNSPLWLSPIFFKFVQRILCLIKKTFEHSHQLFSGKCMDIIG